jgi:uncharacterized protein
MVGTHSRVGVLSDTHNQIERTARAIELLKDRGATVFFHGGDITEEGIIELFEGLEAYFAFGNNDRDRGALERAMKAAGLVCLGEGGEVGIGPRRIALTHGHNKIVLRKLLSASPDFLFLGHSHRKRSERVGSTRLINPGALHRANPKTVACVGLDPIEVEFVEVP